MKFINYLFIGFIFLGCNNENGDNPSAPIQGFERVIIGPQVWMFKNLDVTTYRNGDPIPHVTDRTQWSKLTTGAWCYHNNDSATGAIYGKIYNWYAVNDSRGLTPVGWHVPTNTEWTTLAAYLGGESVAGGKLKETGTAHWISPNTGATNSSSFTALPGGYRHYNGTFSDIGSSGYWWSSSEYEATSAWNIGLYTDIADVYRHKFGKHIGLSVRCVGD